MVIGSSILVGGSDFRGQAAAVVRAVVRLKNCQLYQLEYLSAAALSCAAVWSLPGARLVVIGVMELDKMDENDWKYHGEGNKSLVVSHVQISRVLRLLKYPAEDSENPPQTAEQAFRQIQNIVDFSSNVMSSLLGEKFIHSGEVVKLPLEFVRQLSIKVQHQRPAWRCNKPKCGFLPSSKHVSKDIKTKVCRFCMHQHYKVANGKWKRRSLYCPLDLFSGNRQRMHFAIRHLIEEPQNNFKIFKGGQCIYSSKEGSDDSLDLNSLLHHLRPYFMYGNNRINSHMTGKAVLNDFIQVLVNALLSGGGGDGGLVTDRRGEGRSFCEASLFKERIRHGQNPLVYQAIFLESSQIISRVLNSAQLQLQLKLKRSIISHLQIDGPYNEAFLEKLQKCPSEDDGSVEYAVAKVHQYRVAMTAKDCSIMVALVPSSEKEEDDEGLSSQRRLRDFLSSRPPAFSYSVSILDLDPKPFESIPRQLCLDQKIVSCYLRTGGALPKGSLPPLQGIFSAAEREDCTLLFHPV
ncbi:hypothetical protein INR49_014186 [Caranx melampygus]|nr:hypothetical protein INR49_014186 [Caranx melampygus]